ncbi:trimeric intracellular cation channel family protein [Roseococcus sp. SYP-B2431]|uniref:trimeric intracellular cation channel family protein n=1 Tax=Roseococcus sp. SYP-B2431 TaxID=2496640 RepID=UPI00103D334D|nr:trimeric intracellular cation channel family protein [Roseococcus sp. SYP-B2431]TCH98748.1 trimeric intracellular cation channel family protein [Roseococcus sp. SYP-B2431]
MTADLPVSYVIHALDLVGIFVFALSGAALGTRRGMDVFGVLVLAFVTATSGGILRDLLLGAVPPDSIASWHALAISTAAGLLVFFSQQTVTRLASAVLFFDAVGLGVFAVTGTYKALAFGLSPPMAALLGVISGIGGGMVRDVLTARVPVVLQAEIYAVAALVAALVVVAGQWLAIPAPIVSVAAVGLCLTLRMIAISRKWRLPVAPKTED